MINFADNLNKMITAGLGGETEAPKTEVAVGYRSVYLDASGPVAEFKTNVVAPLKRLLVTMVPKQEGSGDPSPENIRPITGYESVTVTHKGKNLLDLSAGTKGTLQPEGTKTFFIGNSGLLPRPDGSFTLSAGQYTIASYGFRFKTFSIYDSTGAIITTSDRNKYTFTIHESGSYVLHFSISPEDFTSWDDVRVMLTRGASAEEYIPYQAEEIEIQFGSTIYGGRLEVLSGKLYVDYKYLQVLECAKSSQIYATIVLGPLGYVQTGSFNKCNALKFYGGAASGLPQGSFMIINSSGYNNARMNFCFEGCGGSTPIETRDLNQAKLDELAEAGTPLTIVYKLAEPVVIDLEPHQVIALLGKNYVSSDAGDVSVSYLYYEETEGY